MTMLPVEYFGTLAVSGMAICYAGEHRDPRFILGFALACLASSTYAGLIGSWPFMVVEFLWAGLALRRWDRVRHGQNAHTNTPSPDFQLRRHP